MSPVEGNKKLAVFLKKLRTRFEGSVSGTPPIDDATDRDVYVDTLVYSLLLWESTNTNARSAWKKLHDYFIDYNDLRAALPEEIAAAFGEKYPRCEERALRLRAILNDLYGRFHSVTGASFNSLAKRELKTLFESIEGLCEFAADRTLALCFDVHAVPVDDRLRDLFVSEGCIPSDTETSAIARMLERTVESGELKHFCAVLEAWRDAETASGRKEKKNPLKASKPANRPAAKRSASTPVKKKAGKGNVGG